MGDLSIASASNFQSAMLGLKINTAVMKLAKSKTEQDGQAILKLIQSATSVTPSISSTGSVGRKISVVA